MERLTNLLLIRHAETDMAGRFCGHSDPELNHRGQHQLAALISTLSTHAIQRVYASDLRRAQQTADAIARHFGAELHTRRGLREIYFGDWEGSSWNEIETRNGASAKNWVENYPNVTAPGGESHQQFLVRVNEELDFLLEEALNSRIVVVTHAGFIRTVLTEAIGLSHQEAWDRTTEYASIIPLETNSPSGSVYVACALP